MISNRAEAPWQQKTALFFDGVGCCDTFGTVMIFLPLLNMAQLAINGPVNKSFSRLNLSREYNSFREK